MFKPTSNSPLNLISCGIFSFPFYILLFLSLIILLHLLFSFLLISNNFNNKVSVNNGGYSNIDGYNYIIYSFPSKYQGSLQRENKISILYFFTEFRNLTIVIFFM